MGRVSGRGLQRQRNHPFHVVIGNRTGPATARLVQQAVQSPFQVDFLTQEPSGNVLSPIMMTPHRVDPGEKEFVRFQEVPFKPLTQGNDKYVLTGKAAHVPSDEKPVPQFHSFRVEYRVLDGRLSEISRVRIPVH